VLTRAATSDTTVFTAGVATNGIFETATATNEARVTSIIGDGAEEEFTVNNGALHASLGNYPARHIVTDAALIGWDAVGDFSMKVRHKYTADPSTSHGCGLIAWHPGSGGTNDERYMFSGTLGFPDKHIFKVSHENTISLININGAGVDETVFHWVSLTRRGDLITAGWSLDGAAWTDTVDAKAYDMVGNRVWIGYGAGKHNLAGTYASQITDFYISYTPATP